MGARKSEDYILHSFKALKRIESFVKSHGYTMKPVAMHSHAVRLKRMQRLTGQVLMLL